MNQLQETKPDVAAVYALFASVLASEPGKEQIERAHVLLRAAGIDGFDEATADKALIQRFHDRLVVAVSPLYIPAIESCMIAVRKDESGKLEAGQVDGKRMSEVSACYRMYDFDPHALHGFLPLIGTMRPDHLIAELAFMAHLRRLQERGGAQGEAAGGFADAFLNRHLRSWVPMLCIFACQRGEKDLYVHLLEAVHCWTELDAD